MGGKARILNYQVSVMEMPIVSCLLLTLLFTNSNELVSSGDASLSSPTFLAICQLPNTSYLILSGMYDLGGVFSWKILVFDCENHN